MTTRDKLIFVAAMSRATSATVRQCEALMRYAATLQRLAEDDCNVATDDAGLAKREAKRDRIQQKVMELLGTLCNDRYCSTCEKSTSRPVCCGTRTRGCAPVFQNDPCGAVLKIRVPSGFTNDFGGEGICVPS